MAIINTPPVQSPFDRDGVVTREWREWCKAVYLIAGSTSQSGTTAQRPPIKYAGQFYFDKDLGSNGKPIWANKNGDGWVDATGATV
jgi:hypothetical protein